MDVWYSIRILFSAQSNAVLIAIIVILCILLAAAIFCFCCVGAENIPVPKAEPTKKWVDEHSFYLRNCEIFSHTFNYIFSVFININEINRIFRLYFSNCLGRERSRRIEQTRSITLPSVNSKIIQIHGNSWWTKQDCNFLQKEEARNWKRRRERPWCGWSRWWCGQQKKPLLN